MRRFFDMLRSGHVSDDPVAILFHAVRGQMVNWVNGEYGPVHWTANSHRGVQFLDRFEFPRKQKRYIFAPQFDVRYNTAFEDVVRACADPNRDPDHKTWITEPYVRGMVALHRLGFAHSFEAWQDGQLVGGCFGIQLGSMISCDSMFHRVSNASKAAYGQTLVHLHKRGFRLVDTNGVATHHVNYGEEWLPHWQFQQTILDALKESPRLTDDRPCPELPWEVRCLIPTLRPVRVVARRLPWTKPLPPDGPGESAADDHDDDDAEPTSPPREGQSRPAPVTRSVTISPAQD